jgi:hypothetical protein
MSSNSNSHSFDLSTIINPETKQPFPAKYAGEFTVRRPTLRDQSDTSLKYARAVSLAGINADPVRLAMIPSVNLMFIFAHIGTIAVAKPDWFDEDATYEEDEQAIRAVNGEVERWLSTFRPQIAGEGSKPGSADAETLVPA